MRELTIDEIDEAYEESIEHLQAALEEGDISMSEFNLQKRCIERDYERQVSRMKRDEDEW